MGVVVVEWSDSKTRDLEKERMLFFTFILLLGCASVFADGHTDSKGCCEYKRVPGSMPKSGDYFLMEHREDVPDYCKDGCVYMKESSGMEEFCFMSSSRYTAECEDKGEIAVEMPGDDATLATLTATTSDHDNMGNHNYMSDHNDMGDHDDMSDMSDHGDMDDHNDMDDHSFMETTTSNHDNMGDHNDMSDHNDMGDHGDMD